LGGVNWGVISPYRPDSPPSRPHLLTWLCRGLGSGDFLHCLFPYFCYLFFCPSPLVMSFFSPTQPPYDIFGNPFSRAKPFSSSQSETPIFLNMSPYCPLAVWVLFHRMIANLFLTNVFSSTFSFVPPNTPPLRPPSNCPWDFTGFVFGVPPYSGCFFAFPPFYLKRALFSRFLLLRFLSASFPSFRVSTLTLFSCLSGIFSIIHP